MLSALRFVALLFAGLVITLGFALASPGAPVYAQACDPSGSIDGTAQPSTVTPGGVITFTAVRMAADEQVSPCPTARWRVPPRLCAAPTRTAACVSHRSAYPIRSSRPPAGGRLRLRERTATTSQ
jgi:hypothetical protein